MKKQQKNRESLVLWNKPKICKKRESRIEGGKEEGIALEHLSLIMLSYHGNPISQSIPAVNNKNPTLTHMDTRYPSSVGAGERRDID